MQLTFTEKSSRSLRSARDYASKLSVDVSPSVLLLLMMSDNSHSCSDILKQNNLKIDKVVDVLCQNIATQEKTNNKPVFQTSVLEIVQKSYSTSAFLVSADKLFINTLETPQIKKLLDVDFNFLIPEDIEVSSLKLF